MSDRSESGSDSDTEDGDEIDGRLSQSFTGRNLRRQYDQALVNGPDRIASDIESERIGTVRISERIGSGPLEYRTGPGRIESDRVTNQIGPRQIAELSKVLVASIDFN